MTTKAKPVKTETLPAKAEAERITKQYNAQLVQAAKFEVTDLNSYNQGAAMLSILKAGEKELKARHDAIVKPIQQGIAAIKAEFLPHTTRIADAQRHIKNCMDIWRDAENERVAAAQAKILADNRIKNPEVREQKLAAVEAAPLSNTRKVLTLVVDDINAIPGEFFDLNRSKLTAFLKGGGEVAGARLEYQTITVS